METQIPEGDSASIEVVKAPLPKFVQVKESGRIYRIDKEVPAGIIMTELDKHTFEPLSGNQSLTDREILMSEFKPYPLADLEFFQELNEYKTVREIATERTYRVLNCNFDYATIRREGTETVTRVPIDTFYGNYEIVRNNFVCTTCKTTSLHVDRLLN
ncbi:hypothetical protein GF369_01515 [Candidatus Peregrinibacteria bacterium]|nr:hypothetical protein [Candidatus Peregrinibacteria bacterium]